jgi:23S rRNA (cytidine1920-2'-O)/16S rRNA (cytidine1409-2'-O)-methyltransferase
MPRADQLLVERGLASSRSQAQRLIAAGLRWQTPNGMWHHVSKNGEVLPEDCMLELQDDAESRYVSRGGLKLAGALLATGVKVAGLRCLDVGQSTGGFTDVLLQHGAVHVTGVDVGQGQLHPKLQNDPRVRCIEKHNARMLNLDQFKGEPLFDLVVADVSFISLTLLIPAMVDVLETAGQLLLLVKPQFELQPEDIGKGGLVKDPSNYLVVENRLRQCCAQHGVEVMQWLLSSITGGDGNQEFFIYGRKAP